jgi:hypothetical protein
MVIIDSESPDVFISAEAITTELKS